MNDQWREEIQQQMEELIDGYVTDGAPHEEVLAAAMAAIDRLRP